MPIDIFQIGYLLMLMNSEPSSYTVCVNAANGRQCTAWYEAEEPPTFTKVNDRMLKIESPGMSFGLQCGHEILEAGGSCCRVNNFYQVCLLSDTQGMTIYDLEGLQ